MFEPIPWKFLIAVVALLGGAPQSTPNGQLAFVTGEGPTKLSAVPATAPGLALGEVFAGTAVLVEEEREGFARVRLSAWVPVQSLTFDRPADVATRAKEPARPPRVDGIQRADVARIETRLETDSDDVRLVAAVELQTRQRNPVRFTGEYPSSLTVYNVRRIAGATVRGDPIGEFAFTMKSPQTEVVIPISELTETAGAEAVVTVSVAVGQRKIYGTVRGVALQEVTSDSE